jgi:hypothetical protein
MVDRGESTHQRQRCRELPGVLRQRGDERRGAHAEEEDEHHVAAAPDIAQPPGRDRAEPEERESAHAVGHEVRPVCIAEFDGDRPDGGGKDQEKHVVYAVACVQQEFHEGASPCGLVAAGAWELIGAGVCMS